MEPLTKTKLGSFRVLMVEVAFKVACHSPISLLSMLDKAGKMAQWANCLP